MIHKMPVVEDPIGALITNHERVIAVLLKHRPDREETIAYHRAQILALSDPMASASGL